MIDCWLTRIMEKTRECHVLDSSTAGHEIGNWFSKCLVNAKGLDTLTNTQTINKLLSVVWFETYNKYIENQLVVFHKLEL